MANATTNVGKTTPIYNMYRTDTEKITKELKGFFGCHAVELSPSTEYTQDKNNLGVIVDNKSTASREVGCASQESFLSESDINRQQAEDLYDEDILPTVEKIFSCRDNGDIREAPMIGIIHVLKTNTNTENVINFLYNDPDTISGIIEEGSYIEFTAVIDLLLNKINNTDITEKQSRQAFSILDRLYKKLPEIDHIKPSLYGKMHALFSLLINDNRTEIINTLTEAMTSEHSNKYFNLYINKNEAIENNYLDLINKIYSSTKDNQESDYILFEKLLAFIGANDLTETEINSAKALHLARTISDIVSNFDESHQDIFIKYFLARKKRGNKFDNLLLQTLKQNGLLEKNDTVINNKKDISKIPSYKVIDYTLEKNQKIPSSNKIDNEWLLEDIEDDRNQQILLIIDKLDVYNFHSLVGYLLSPSDIVFQDIIASKSTQVYERMIDLLIAKLQSVATTISKEDSDKIAGLLTQLYIKLPSIGAKSQTLCSKIYEAFNLLIPKSINIIIGVLRQANNDNPNFYLPVSVTKNKKFISDFLELVVKIYKTPVDDYKLLYELLEYIKINVSDNISKRQILFFSEKLYKIIINLSDKEKQSIVIKLVLDSLKLSVNMKYYLFCMFHDAKINRPDCNFQPLSQSSISSTKQQMALMKISEPYFF